MKTKVNDNLDWHRIFKILPVTTQDGFRVLFDHVWRKKVETKLGHAYAYHTNPDGREDKFQEKRAKRIRASGGYQPVGHNPPPPTGKRPPPPPSPPRPRFNERDRLAVKRIMEMQEQRNTRVKRHLMNRPKPEGPENVTMGKSKKLPKNQKLGYYTGSKGPG